MDSEAERLKAGDLWFGLGFWLRSLGGNRADVHANDSEGGATNAVSQKNSECHRCEAGTGEH
jgi:hypothetical protein